jgi:nuclear pore complex protein Nup155
VDDERDFLYAYTKTNAALHIYNLGPAGSNQITVRGIIPSLARAIQPLLPPNPSARRFASKETFGIVGLHVIPRSESRNICLVAVAFNGLRIYFSDTYSGYGQTGIRPVHLRFPPPTEANDVGDIVVSSYTNGSMLCAHGSETSPDSNPVVGCTIDVGKLIKAQAGIAAAVGPGAVTMQNQSMGNIYSTYPTPRPPLNEFSNIVNVPGRTWALKQMVKPSSVPQHQSGSIWTTATSNPTALNTIVTQFTEPPDQFMVLSNVALSFIVKKRTSDVLRGILEMEAGGSMNGSMNGPPSVGGLSAFIDA